MGITFISKTKQSTQHLDFTDNSLHRSTKLNIKLSQWERKVDASKEHQNVVFDIGNVIVRWSPIEITRLTFGEVNDLQQRSNSIFQSDIWLDLNKGKSLNQKPKTLSTIYCAF